MSCTLALVITAIEQTARIHSCHNTVGAYPTMLPVASASGLYPGSSCCKTKKALNYCSSHLKITPMRGLR